LTAPHVVWARNGASTTSCPKSYITPQSKAWLEEYYAWKLGNATDFRKLPARGAEAFWILEGELAKGNSSAQG